ncbi:CYFA0S06e02366g1_1 [Cyberlindnera fabianii]|uniref:acid phosphatase n=1 Tax=Cyberlindnera fabianii TaxID=36022 RepID=A0A061B289_CYBFA|nr:Acid phosphatase PHO1 [Cyberlindnera fabianii]CDR41133.1 CYFA0S06e02366g1_1 [Cyberlindnera fabianii]
MQLSLALAASIAACVAPISALPMQVLKSYDNKPYPQEALDQYNVLRFLGTASPYVQQPGHGIQRDTPHGCSVSQVSLIARHGERYLTANKGKKTANAISRLQNITEELDGPVAFLTTYDFEGLDQDWYDKETWKGPYAGLGEMYKFGQLFRYQYDHLVGDDGNVTFYTASQERVVVSAQKFAEGFLGYTADNSSFFIIDEDDASLGGNSLTPVTGCVNYDDTTNEDLIATLSDAYLNQTTARLNDGTPGINLTTSEVAGLFDYCGFDLNVGGKSDICEIFTNDELIARAYYNDIDYYYTKGPGYNLSSAIGSVYVNAMIEIMKDGDRNLTLNFAHDTDIFFIVTLLGLYDSDMPLDHQNFDSLWKVSNINPMGSRLILEKLTCEGDQEGDFVRIVHNDAVLPISEISSGPGFSAPLDDFEDYVNKRLNGTTFAEACGLKNNTADSISFYWD